MVQQFLIDAVATFLNVVGAHLNILFIIKVKIVALIKWSYSLPPTPNYVAYWAYNGHLIWTCSPIVFEHISFWYLFLELQLTTHHPNIGVQSRKSIRIWVLYLMITTLWFLYFKIASWMRQFLSQFNGQICLEFKVQGLWYSQFWQLILCTSFGCAARDAPYAKARTTFVRDVQMARNVLSNHFSRPAPAAYSDSTPLNPAWFLQTTFLSTFGFRLCKWVTCANSTTWFAKNGACNPTLSSRFISYLKEAVQVSDFKKPESDINLLTFSGSKNSRVNNNSL